MVLGLILCEGLAALLSVLFNSDAESRQIAPWICLQAVILAGVLCGRLSGLVGSIAATLTFAIWLFPPVGSMAVHDAFDLLTLLGFQLIAIGIAAMCPQRPSGKANSLL
jgi:K+-sensing histidine kinase KdpD